MQAAVEQAQASVVLFGGTSNGRDLAPRLAGRLNSGVASDVDRLEWANGKLRARRPVYSGKAFATVEVSGAAAIATVRPNAFPAAESGGAAAEIVSLAAPVPGKSKLIETKVPEAGGASSAPGGSHRTGGPTAGGRIRCSHRAHLC